MENSFIDLPPSSPNPHTNDFSEGLDCESDGYDEVLSPHPPSFDSFDPLDCELLCSLVFNPSFDVHGDQVLDGVSVEEPTCDIIYYDYVWEPIAKQESMMKDDSYPSAPLPYYLDIFHGLVIPGKSSKESFCDHSQNTWNSIFSSKGGEDKSIFLDLSILSSHISKNIEVEIYLFQSSPLYNSSNHLDASVCNLKLSNLNWHDIFLDSFLHDLDFSTVDLSKPPVFDDPSFGELEHPQAIMALQPKLMVMSSSHILEVSSTFDQKCVESLQAPHHSVTYIENQSVLQF